MKKNLTFTLLIVLITSFLSAQTTDIKILRNIQTSYSENTAKRWNVFSESTYPICIATPILLWSIGKVKKDKTIRSKAYQMAVAEAVTMGSVFILKKIIDKDRPYEKFSDIRYLEKQSDASMPSGHTSAAFAAATSLTLSYPKWYVIVPSYLWAGGVGYSRMYLGQHYPSDVAVGALLGSASAVGTYYLNKLIFKPKK